MLSRLIGAVAALALAAGAAEAQTIKIGSKNFTEQFVVGHMYAEALEAAGFKVERKINLGSFAVAHGALTKGEIDLYPEYTGTALNNVVKAAAEGGPDGVYATVKAHYEKEFKLTWLKPTGINNGYAIVVRGETAAQHKLKTLSDLAKVSKTLVLGAGPEFLDRKDGIPGLKAVYGMEFKEFKQFSSYPLRYKAFEEKQIDVVNGFATDWQIAAGKYVALDDDKGLFPPYYLAAVVRMDTLEKNPRIRAAIEAVGPHLTNTVMAELNRQVEVDKKEPKAVAAAFLKSKGLIK